MMTMTALMRGSALSALAGLLALSAIPTAALAQDAEQAERPRFERQAPREARSFRPEASRPAREERIMDEQDAPERVAPRGQQPAEWRTQRADRSAEYGGPGLRPDRNRTAPIATERPRNQLDWRGMRRNNRAEQEATSRSSRQDYSPDRREGTFALDPNRYDGSARNRTYRDGYRDGRYADRRDDRRDNRDAYRSGYRDGRREDWSDDRRDNRHAYRNGYRDGQRWGYDNHHKWDRRWRDNRRYDWYRYRSYNRDLYRLGRYYSPYRYHSYRRLGIGFTLDSLFFGSRYWIHDPWQYRLPEVYGPYRWVRYYDDVLLVNIYTGEVVDVIYDFFW